MNEKPRKNNTAKVGSNNTSIVTVRLISFKTQAPWKIPSVVSYILLAKESDAMCSLNDFVLFIGKAYGQQQHCRHACVETK